VVVLDSSAAVQAVSSGRASPLVERMVEEDLHAPHLIDLEVLNALRGLVRGRKVSAERVEYARADYFDLSITRYPHEPLAARVWALRENLTAYDAAYVALAEALEAPLLSCDVRLASATEHGVRIELFDG
jgi:predicted nucleic acid-binding protein